MSKENKRKQHYSGIGGQAVIEGIMMKNKEEYSLAVRKPDGSIAVEKKTYKGILSGRGILKVPFLRGVFVFIDSMVLGIKTINDSAAYFEEEPGKDSDIKLTETVPETETENTETENTETENAETENAETENTAKEKKVEQKAAGDKRRENVQMGFVVTLSLAIAIGLFTVLPFYLSRLLKTVILNESVLNLVEGLFRILIFVIYLRLIACMKDMQRVFMYHGAEHKCINCIEHGRPLNVENVMRSSRQHRRCGTSFLLYVMLISIFVFFFISVDNMGLKLLFRVLLIPVIAGISYEILSFAGKHSNGFVRALAAPGLWMQKLTTREPDADMAEVAIAAVEAVFDWKKYLQDEFGYDEDDWKDYEESSD